MRVVAAVSMMQVAAEQADGERELLPLSERATAEQMVQRVLSRHKAVFPEELPKLPAEARAEELRCPINLKEGTVPFGRYGVRMTQEHTVAAEKMLKELLAKGFIRPSRSPWGSPMFLVAKPDGGLRMVIDYRALNKATVRNRYPLPRVDELFDQLQGARYFSKLDLRTGYWQIRMAEDDIAKTAFTSRHGHFEWTVMPMGLTNAPAEFMALMENTFREELNKFVLVFLDDILIYSRTLEEHEQHLNVVLERLGAAKLYGKLSKCQFARAEVEFLGHYVGRSGVRMVDGKVAAVQNWPTPRTQKDVEQFIGLAGYYRRFIDGFSRLAAPLTELCGTLTKAKGGAVRKPPQKQFVWGEAQAEAFERLKA
ncbi:MAG: RNA-directed DNA polymerase, partial [Deltaproteobacteria bacterium]